ncbi:MULTISPECIES: hypothetical protein [Pimelobacter]|uniref:hypothetical protein n=1 Tax=Pimelobacter TaxID=2044 RepID=UPI001C04B57A|nr:MULTISPECIES: hypothetical protein [Pimelobacter]MBU2698846.1 hypothetical protein [Pimelobacter sp. 30-1]UUW93036.1 hypothetical protein M0M43_30550 [Pimelobacter simplex]UUW99068.1 hypothetical protein M0M48_30570 [Pimelobacter simplex]
MSVEVALRVLGSQALAALIRHYRLNPGSQVDAVRALGLTAPIVSANTRILIDAGVVVGRPESRGRRAGIYAVDEERLNFLVDELKKFVAGEEPRTPGQADAPSS